MSEANPYQPPSTAHEFEPPSASDVFTLEGCLTLRDYQAAARLATPWRWPRFIFVIAGSSVFSLVFLVIGFSAQESKALVIALALPAIELLVYGWEKIRLRKAARRQFGVFARTHAVVSTAKIVSSSEGGKSELEWTFFSKIKFDENVLLLYFRNSPQYLILARSKLANPAEWPALVNLVRYMVAGFREPK